MSEVLINTLEKIQKLFIRFGVKSVTMDDIARELGVSKKTLYQQFTDKNDMVKKMVLYNLANQQEQCKAVYSEALNPIDCMLGISEMLGKMFSQIHPSLLFELKKYHSEAFDLIELFKSDFVRDQLRSNIEEGKMAGWYRREINSEITSGLYLCLTDTLVNADCFSPDKYSYSMILREAILYHLHAIVTDKGKRYMYEKLNQKL